MEYAKENNVYTIFLFIKKKNLLQNDNWSGILRNTNFHEMYMYTDYIEYKGNIWINILAQKGVARNSINKLLCKYKLHKFNFRMIKVFPCKNGMAHTSRSFLYKMRY